MSSLDPVVWPPGWRRRHSSHVTTATAPTPPDQRPAARLELRAGGPPAYCVVEVEDEDDFDVEGHSVHYRRLGHREAGVEVLSEEWTWLVDGASWVLTGTVRREDYLAVCEVFEAVAASVDVTWLRSR
ncbi:hypothetical protein [Nocardioides coralli]|uniref:hypothetical protein n=1 Tax=Nocardioides coralli TaxID=2872154 RepID=UPI001CA3EA61|nr:hypothetical protein [Nocardioides coralli]QZY28902.1 hypothetical protein K6T13_15870 [Nocardioides coralli]